MVSTLIALAIAGPTGAVPDIPVDISKYIANKVQVKRSGTGLAVEFLPTEWPNIRFDAEPAWDWSGTGGLALDIRNPGTRRVEFFVRADDDVKADGIAHCRTGAGTLEPGRSAHFLLPLGVDPMSMGMRGLPPIGGDFTLLSSGGGSPLDLKHIVAFQVFLHNPAGPTSLIIDRVRLVSASLSMDRIVDQFGQYAKAQWPGKVTAEVELKDRRRQESESLAAAPALAGFDRYGGWEQGPKLTATGYFRTEKHGGKWWLVTPEGRLFFSFGMDCIGNQGATILTGRERMFASLPPKDGPLGQFYGYTSVVHSGPVKQGETFDFLGANLKRKYGDGFMQAWLDTSLKRLRSWGFNTIGNWSDPSLYRNSRVPYVATAGVDGPHARVPSGQDYWGLMHDPFDPQFAVDVRRNLRSVAAQVGDDPWCLGWFVDNEISWGGGNDDRGRYGLSLGTLRQSSAASPAKRAFVEQLRSTYSTVLDLNRSWNTSFASWESLDGATTLPAQITEGCRRDLAAFSTGFAETYFRTIRDELKRVAPHHLYLGCRFAWYTPESAQAAAKYCDVVSFNIYRKTLDPSQSDFYAALNKPIVIGEFHFGALDRGMFHTGLVATSSQKERAETYAQYVRSVLDHPSFVGCHWFQYHDEPLTGRTYDGENYNIGFVSVTDTPYPEMVDAAKRVHAEAYSRRTKTEAAKRP